MLILPALVLVAIEKAMRPLPRSKSVKDSPVGWWTVAIRKELILSPSFAA
jgi:hypothetical protein